MEKTFDDGSKLEKVKVKKEILNFSVNHEGRINDYLKSLEKSGGLTTDQYKKIKAIGSKPRVLSGLCKVHKAIIGVSSPFRPIFSAIGTPSHKLAKFLVPKLSSFTFNIFTVKDSFAFAEERYIRTVNSSWVALLLTHSLFTDLLFTINVCTSFLYNHVDVTEGINKFEFENLLKLHAYLHICHPNMFFHLSKKKNGNLSFLVVEVSRQQGKFVTTVYRKPTFSGMHAHFDSFLPPV